MAEIYLHLILAFAIIEDTLMAAKLRQGTQSVPGAVLIAPALPLHMELDIVPLTTELFLLFFASFYGPAKKPHQSGGV